MKVEGYIHDGWLLISAISPELDSDFLYSVLSSQFVVQQFSRAATGGVVNNLNSEIVRNIVIPLPSIGIQKQISTELDEIQNLIIANKQLIERMEQKIHYRIQRVWSAT